MERMSMKALIVAAPLALGGCTYDYLQRTDRVAYSAGDAVKANLERETLNPSRKSSHRIDGLGRDGVIAGDGGAAGAE